MLEFHFSYRGVLKHLGDGALGAEMDRIAGYFVSLGYKRASDLLEHRRINTTALYVKVAASQLAEVALLFPRGAA